MHRCLLAFLGPTFLGGQVLAAEEHLSFCYDPYPPYTLGEEGETRKGLKVRLLEEVVAQIPGVTASVTLMPWQRCQLQTRSGKFDGILPLFPNAERGEYLDFTDNAFEQRSAFWYSRAKFPDGLSWDGTYDEISSMRLGMLLGSHIDGEMEAAFDRQGNLTRAESVASLFLMLQHDRIDLIAIDSLVAQHTIAERATAGLFAEVVPPLRFRFSQFGLSKVTGANSHLSAFNAAISSLRTNGRIKEIQNGQP